LHFHHLEQWKGIGRTSGGGLLPGTQDPKELSRELQKFGNLSTRLALESQKVEVWNGKLIRLFGIHIDRVQKARKREFDANKRREGNLVRENKRLLAQNRQLRLALDNSRSEIKFTSSQFTRLDLENM